jgi:hypothetical protein
MRVDMLAIALAFLGVALTVRATRRPAWLMLAMSAVFLMMKPRAAILAGLGGAVLGLGALAWLEWQTAWWPP